MLYIRTLLVLLTLIASVHADTLPVSIKPDDANLYYAGRFDRRDPAGPRGQWPQSMLTVRFQGTDLQAGLKSNGKDLYAVVVDGGEPTTIQPGEGTVFVDLAKGLSDAEHTVQLVKRTEAFVGVMQITGVYLNQGGKLLEPKKLPRKIEVIGDSISAGYGNESANEKEHFAPKTENAYMTYGAITARAVNAEYVCVAWSGKKMAPDNTIPELYDLSLPTDKKSTYDFSTWKPDVVLINLATNDFGKAPPDEAMWTAAYVAFVKRVRGNYPDATIYLASGSMMYGKKLEVLKGYMTKIEATLKTDGDAKIRIIHFDPQNGGKDGLGGDWHPSIKTHQKMAAKWIEALRTDMGW